MADDKPLTREEQEATIKRLVVEGIDEWRAKEEKTRTESEAAKGAKKDGGFFGGLFS